jgi:hypothetical protein
MNNCEFKEIVAFKDFEIKNNILKLNHNYYLNIINFVDSSILRKV